MFVSPEDKFVLIPEVYLRSMQFAYVPISVYFPEDNDREVYDTLDEARAALKEYADQRIIELATEIEYWKTIHSLPMLGSQQSEDE